MLRKRITVILLVIAGFNAASSQEVQKKAELNGYLTTMQSVMFDSLSGSFVNENLIHNRLNFKGYLNEHLTFAAELRNRLFTGDMVRLGSAYSGMTGADQGWIDMSWNLLDKKSFLLNTTIDRLWLDARYDKFQVTVGRQRINWGQTFVWNPNDIFNAYSFFDFDYVERPGSDAVRIQYFPTFSSAAEVAVKVDNDNDITAAGLFRFNKWGYDIQFLAGYVNSEDFVIGTGWSGAIGSVSFRGEMSLFQPFDGNLTSQGTGLATLGFDKVFRDNSMAQIQVMYCNNPMKLNNFTSFYSGSMSAKDLAFSRFSAFGQFTWAATPLLNTGLSAMWFPDMKGWFAGPSVDYSLSDNSGFSLLWQHFYSKTSGERTRINIAFLRLKYSF
jgi:hypothetical protein